MTSDNEKHEYLQSGVASIPSSGDDDSGTSSNQVRIVPLGEGDITYGGSEKKTFWDQETLQQAVEDGAFDGAKLLKGRPGEGHKDILDQADPDNIVGQAGEFEYEEGVGPVTEEGDLLDDHLAALAERGLVEVSPDMLRELGEFDEELGAYRVERIIDVPYITILDRGAADSAEIQPVDAEALGESAGPDVQALAETLGVPSDKVEDVRATDEQLGGLFTLRFSAFGEMFGDEFLDEAVDNLEDIDGVAASRSASNDDPELVAVIDRESVDVGTLNDDIIDALDDTPFEVHGDYDWISEVAWEGLGEKTGDEPGGTPGTSSGAGADDSSGSATQSNMTDKDIDELQEQLSEVRSEKEDLAEERDELQEQLEDREGRVEQLEEEVENLEEEMEPLKEMLAERVASDSPLDSDSVADRYSSSELVEMLAQEHGWDEEESDETPVDVVKEQLGQPPTPRSQGEAEETPDGGGGVDERTEQLAEEVLDAGDRLSLDADESPVEFLQREYDVDPSEYDDVEQLRAAKNGVGQEV